MPIKELLELMAARGASDLHLVVPAAPVMRIHGVLHTVDGVPALTGEEAEKLFTEITSEPQRAAFATDSELDFAYVVPGLARFRVNACRQKGSVSLVLRLISETVPNMDSLRLPKICKELILKPRGLVMLTGPTGSGKSTTLAAMIDYLNNSESRRVVTIEDPIEYLHGNKKCLVSQREVGGDTKTFAHALRHVLRQNPDVILVGEMRDGETAAAALTAAETGHLVLTTGHAPSADQAIERVIDLFPPYQQNQIRSQLASVLEGVLCQVLVPTKDGNGRVPAVEVMLATAAVRNLIREGKNFQLPNVIRTSLDAGMQTLDRALAALCGGNLITRKDGLSRARNPQEFELFLKS
jgi:twitching motility protein PilT